jgi:hypothetical protein
MDVSYPPPSNKELSSPRLPVHHGILHSRIEHIFTVGAKRNNGISILQHKTCVIAFSGDIQSSRRQRNEKKAGGSDTNP